MDTKRKICVFIGSRANYGSLKSAMRAIDEHPDLELQLVVGASALLDKYGAIVKTIEKDGFHVNEKVHMVIEGSSPITMAKSAGFGLSELATSFYNLSPDFVLVVGDRYEILPAAIAATYMNIPLAHSMGGEVSGTIDESIRHAVTKLAHVHFPASPAAEERIVKLGENPEHVFRVGCPRMDMVSELLGEDHDAKSVLDYLGVGDVININEPFLLVSQHPVTTEFGEGEKQIDATLTALERMGIPTIMLWPNDDAGSEEVARGMRKFREHGRADKFTIRFFKNLPLNVYFTLMKNTACMVGNSSSLIREGSFIGTPGVLVGSRQNSRERGDNVTQVGYNPDEIVEATKAQLVHGPYKPTRIYGDGTAGEQVAATLASVEVPVQKLISY